MWPQLPCWGEAQTAAEVSGCSSLTTVTTRHMREAGSRPTQLGPTNPRTLTIPALSYQGLGRTLAEPGTWVLFGKTGDLMCPRRSYPGSRASGRISSRELLGPREGRDSPKVQEGADVIIPGEGPEQLHHFCHVLLSTRPWERRQAGWVLLSNPHHPRYPRVPWLLPFQGPRGHSSWAGTSLGLPRTNVFELQRDP